MACGLPIVASKVRGNYDLIDQGKGGYLVEPIDVDGFVKAIHKITENKERRAKMKQYNLKKVQKYSIETVVDQMADLYQDMM